jgi:hypothetical protein
MSPALVLTAAGAVVFVSALTKARRRNRAAVRRDSFEAIDRQCESRCKQGRHLGSKSRGCAETANGCLVDDIPALDHDLVPRAAISEDEVLHVENPHDLRS